MRVYLGVSLSQGEGEALGVEGGAGRGLGLQRHASGGAEVRAAARDARMEARDAFMKAEGMKKPPAATDGCITNCPSAQHPPRRGQRQSRRRRPERRRTRLQGRRAAGAGEARWSAQLFPPVAACLLQPAPQLLQPAARPEEKRYQAAARQDLNPELHLTRQRLTGQGGGDVLGALVARVDEALRDGLHSEKHRRLQR